jgi:hypothetical protein
VFVWSTMRFANVDLPEAGIPEMPMMRREELGILINDISVCKVQERRRITC